MEKMFYKIGEVAQMLQENVSRIRYWSDQFPRYVCPQRIGNKADRFYRAQDIEALKKIQMLSQDGQSLQSIERKLKNKGEEVDNRYKILSSLKELKSSLEEIKNLLNLRSA